MLGAVVLTTRDRPGAAGVVAALGALVKLTGVLGLLALLVTTAVRGDRQALRRMALAAGAVFGLGYLMAGVTALLAPMQTAGALYSRGSPWSIVRHLGASQPDPHVALALLALLVLIVIARHRHDTPGTAVTASLAMLGLAASYTLPGYLAWGLPAAALDHRSRVSRIAAAAGVVLVVTYEIVRHRFAGSTGHALFTVVSIGGPFFMLALVVALVRTRTHPTQERTPMTMTAPLAPAPIHSDLPRVLVVIPTLNERANIETVLTRVRASLPEADVLIVDDGSTDGTAELAEAVGETRGQIEVLRGVGPRGLGPAYRAGFEIGLSDGYHIVIQMDADLSHDPEELPAMVGALRSGTDMAIGSRYVPGGDTPGWPARRRALSKAGGWYARTMLRLPVRDVTSGYRAYRTSLLRAMETDTVTTTGFGFQIDMTVRAVEAGAAITEIPIVFRDRSAGDSKMSRTIVVGALLMVTRRAFDRRHTPHHAPASLEQTSTRGPAHSACVPAAVPEVRSDRLANPTFRANVASVS